MPGQDISITTRRLRMQPFRPEDADEAYACITPTLTRYMAFEPAESPAAFAEIWQSWLPKIASGEDITFVIRHDGAFIGFCGLHRTGDLQPELGIWIRESAHGLGYGREAVEAVAHWASAHLPALAYIYPVATENTASRRIAEGLGGTIIGRRDTAKYPAVVYQIPALP